VSRILEALPPSRQTALFSATFPDAIESMSRAYQRDAVRVTIDDPDEARVEIRQWQLAVSADEKLHALCWILERYPHESALIFCNFKATVAELTETLSAAGWSVDRLDGDLDQFQRDQVLARFRNESVRLLVATDVAGRGIDVEGLDLVINYEMPRQPEVYVHRIGRTGRAGRKGVAVSLAMGSRDTRIEAAELVTGQAIESLTREPDEGRDLATMLRSLARKAKMDTIHIAGGRKQRMRPGDILGALTGEAGGLAAEDVGKIEVRDRLTYVAVSKQVSREAVRRLNRGRIKGKSLRATLVRGASI